MAELDYTKNTGLVAAVSVAATDLTSGMQNIATSLTDTGTANLQKAVVAQMDTVLLNTEYDATLNTAKTIADNEKKKAGEIGK